MTVRGAMHEILILQLLILLAVANGTPVIAKLILGDKFAAPVDGGALFADGRPWFGPSKTIRGLVLAVLATTGAAAVARPRLEGWGPGWDGRDGKRSSVELREAQAGASAKQPGHRPRSDP